jgi:hypothetical protein
MTRRRQPVGDRMRVLIVDAANVVGSRPDGWWRDRAAAAERVHTELSAAELPYEEIILVLEGAARGGPPAGRQGCLRTVHAAGSGDDALVQQASEQVGLDHDVAVVTADRGLQRRLEAIGADTLRPSWLLHRL